MAEKDLGFDSRICELTQRNINQRITDVEKRLIQAIAQASEVMKLADSGRSEALGSAIDQISKKFEEVKENMSSLERKCNATEDSACNRCRQIVDACKSAEMLKFEHFESELEHLREHIDSCAKEVKEKELKALGKRIDVLTEERIKPLEEDCDDIKLKINSWTAYGTVIFFVVQSIPWILKIMGIW